MACWHSLSVIDFSHSDDFALLIVGSDSVRIRSQQFFHGIIGFQNMRSVKRLEFFLNIFLLINQPTLNIALGFDKYFFCMPFFPNEGNILYFFPDFIQRVLLPVAASLVLISISLLRLF